MFYKNARTGELLGLTAKVDTTEGPAGLQLGCPSWQRFYLVFTRCGLSIAPEEMMPPSNLKGCCTRFWESDAPAAEKAFEILAVDERWHVRADLASCMPLYHRYITNTLMHDVVACVRASIARNPCTPPEITLRMVNDPELLVHLAARGLNMIPPEEWGE